MWSFSVKSPRSFYFYQVWGSGAIVGVFLFLFAGLLGVGAHLLGANADVNANGFAISNILPEISNIDQASLIFYFIESFKVYSPAIVGFLRCLYYCRSPIYYRSIFNDVWKYGGKRLI